MTEGINAIAQRTRENFVLRDGDYQVDGLAFCGNCRTQKQKRIVLGQKELVVCCMCQCESEAYDREQEEERKRRRMDQIEQMRSAGVRLSLRGCTFQADEGKNPKQMKLAKRYVTQWDKMFRENMGLLFWGNTGNGKTFTAACIANELISSGVPALITSFPKILENAQGMYGEDRLSYFRSFDVYDLLVIDDLGAERKSDFAMEIVYSVIDQRYITKKPMIITTNLTLDEIKEPESMTLQRIYDRISEMCIPVEFKGESLREGKAQEKINHARAILYGGG